MNRRTVILFSLIDQTKFGGSSVYTAHLYRSLEAAGWSPYIVRASKRTEKEARVFTHGLPYFNYSIQDCYTLARQHPSHICYAHWKTHSREALDLLDLGLSITIHDPHDFYDEQFQAIASRGCKVVAIRRTNARMMAERGVPARFIPHPYWRSGITSGPRPMHAVCLASIYHRKRQALICDANARLPKDKRVQLYGTLNRLYAHTVLDKKWPDWRAEYHGTLPTEPDASVRLLSKARYAVDLTVMGHGDGDGSQYSFLEAWDAGTPLIVHRDWILTGKDAVREGETAIAVDSADALREVMLDGADRKTLVDGGREQLQEHGWDKVVPIYEEVIHGV